MKNFVKNCDNCQSRKNVDGSECKWISERSELLTRKKDFFLVGDDDYDGACGMWKAEPNRFYAVEGKRFRAFPYFPNQKKYLRTRRDGVLVTVEDIVSAYIKLNKWKRKDIIFYMLSPVPGFSGYSTVLRPADGGAYEQKKIVKLVKAIIPRVSFDCIIIDNFYDRTEEDDFACAVTVHPPASPPPNDRDAPQAPLPVPPPHNDREDEFSI